MFACDTPISKLTALKKTWMKIALFFSTISIQMSLKGANKNSNVKSRESSRLFFQRSKHKAAVNRDYHKPLRHRVRLPNLFQTSHGQRSERKHNTQCTVSYVTCVQSRGRGGEVTRVRSVIVKSTQIKRSWRTRPALAPTAFSAAKQANTAPVCLSRDHADR